MTKWKTKFKFRFLFHSHQKRKDSQETRIVLLIFLLELKIFGVAVKEIHQNSENGGLQLSIFIVEMTLTLL